MEKSYRNILLIALLYALFTLSGIFEERLYKSTYSHNGKEHKFKHPIIALAFITFLGMILSATWLKLTKKPETNLSSPLNTYDKLTLGGFYLGSRLCAETSMNFLDFVSKIIGKSCKSLSIMIIYLLYSMPGIGSLLKKIISQHENTKIKSLNGFSDLMKVILTTSSVIMFNLEGASGHTAAKQSKYFSQMVIGYILLICSLLFDGVLALKEETIKEDIHKPIYHDFKSRISWEYMFLFNFYSTIFMLVPLSYKLYTGEISHFVKVFLFHNDFIINLICYSASTILGQLIIYKLLQKFGPLQLSIITSIRKVLSVSLSIILFGKKVGYLRMCALGFGFIIIIWEIYEKSNKKKHEETINHKKDQ